MLIPIPAHAREATPTPASVEVEVSATPAESALSADACLSWHDLDATIADPDAMAVFELHDETATVASTLVAEREDLPLDRPEPDLPEEDDDDALTRPWEPAVVIAAGSADACTRPRPLPPS